MNCKDVKASVDTASRQNPIEREAHAHLAGCPDCRSYSDQSSALLALLSAQPRVAAPADFDFRLRARIARKQAEPASPFAFLENFFGQAFSLKQAATSLAALAVMAAGTTLYFTQSNQPTQNATIAYNQPSASKTMETPKLRVEAPAPVFVGPVKSPASVVRTAVLANNSAKPMMVAGNNDTAKAYNRQKGVLIAANNSSVVYGAEKSVSATKSQEFIPSL
ncbi:MAG: hypothetical protein SF097_08140 [Acidobacteriota bacterium]|nr:hypothetical protein [Acidobacteriota bacterium]